MKNKKTFLLGFAGALLLSVFAHPETTKAELVQTAQTQNSITFKWDGDEDAANYKIYYKVNDYNVDFGTTPITVPATQLSYTLSNLTPGSSYNVRITYDYISPYSGTCYTYNADSGTVKTLPTKVTGVKQDTWWYYAHSVDYSWDKQNGADGYEYIVKNTKNKTVTTDTASHYSANGSFKTKNTMVYNVIVRSYSDINGVRYYGDYSNKAYMFSQPMIKKAKISGGKLKVNWNKVSGCTGYDIYVSTKEKSGYKKVKSVNSKVNSVTLSKFKKKKFNAKKNYYVYIVGKKKVGKNVYTSGRHYTCDTKTSSTHWTFN